MAVLGIYRHVQEGEYPLRGGGQLAGGGGGQVQAGEPWRSVPHKKKIRGAHWDKNSIFLENAEDGVSLTPVGEGGFFDRDGDFLGGPENN